MCHCFLCKLSHGKSHNAWARFLSFSSKYQNSHISIYACESLYLLKENLFFIFMYALFMKRTLYSTPQNILRENKFSHFFFFLFNICISEIERIKLSGLKIVIYQEKLLESNRNYYVKLSKITI